MLGHGSAWLVRLVPTGLIVFRALAGLAIPVVALTSPDAAQIVCGLVWAGLISDIFDGVLARRLGVATDALRRWDSLVDLGFWLAVLAALVLLCGSALAPWWPALVGLLLAEAAILAVNLVRFGRPGATHAWSAKAFGLALLAGVTELLLTGATGLWFHTMVWVGAASMIDVMLIALLLPDWRRDVPSAWHASRPRAFGGLPDP